MTTTSRHSSTRCGIAVRESCPRRHERPHRRRWPDRGPALEEFFLELDYELAEPRDPSVPISDPKDQPILDAAIAAAAEVIVSGDKHLLSLDLDRPQILTARGFLDTYGGPDPTK